MPASASAPEPALGSAPAYPSAPPATNLPDASVQPTTVPSPAENLRAAPEAPKTASPQPSNQVPEAQPRPAEPVPDSSPERLRVRPHQEPKTTASAGGTASQQPGEELRTLFLGKRVAYELRSGEAPRVDRAIGSRLDRAVAANRLADIEGFPSRQTAAAPTPLVRNDSSVLESPAPNGTTQNAAVESVLPKENPTERPEFPMVRNSRPTETFTRPDSDDLAQRAPRLERTEASTLR